MEKITLETINGKSENEIMTIFYNSFFDYGKSCAKYIAYKHNMDIIECACYIASGLYQLLLKRIEQLKNDNTLNNNMRFLIAFFGTQKLVKKIMAMTNYSSYFKNNKLSYGDDLKVNGHTVGSETVYRMNKYKYSNNKYSEYRNVKKVNTNIIDIVDVLEQKENRDSKKSISYDSDDTGYFRDSLRSNYGNPEQDLLCKLSRFYSHVYAEKIRQSKDYMRLMTLKDSISSDVKMSTKTRSFLRDFKHRHGLETLKTREIYYILENY
jgi:hypothetical protein